jgi:hypothetical protein
MNIMRNNYWVVPCLITCFLLTCFALANAQDEVKVYSENISVADDFIAGNHEVFAKQSIVADNLISDKAFVYYKARSSILLTTGFKVDAGSRFKADLGDHNQNSSFKSSSVRSLTKLFTLYPNPNPGIFNVVVKSVTGDNKLLIYNSSGVLVYEEANVEGEFPVDLGEYPKGLYVVQVNNPNEVYTEKVIIQ